MTFFKDQQIHEFDVNCANRLKNGLIGIRKQLRQEGKQTSKIEIFKWAREFYQLRHQLNDNRVRISKVLDWYLKNIGGEYTPRSYSARSFRAKFGAIENAMGRFIPETSQLQIGEDAKQVQESLALLRWPFGPKEKSQLLECLQLSLSNYELMVYSLRFECQRLQEYAESKVQIVDGHRRVNSKDSQGLDLIEQVLGMLPPSKQFVENWFHEVWNVAWRWDKWDGNLKVWAFHIGHNKFFEIIRAIVVDYCGDESRVKEVLDACRASTGTREEDTDRDDSQQSSAG